MSCCTFGIAYTPRDRRKSFIIREVFIAATLASSFSVPVLAQSGRPEQDLPAQTQTAENPDLINPDRPGIADGSNVIGAKRFQIESGIQEEFHNSGDSREHTFFVPTLFRFGIDGHWEVRIEGNTFTRVTAVDSASATNHTAGFAPVSIGFKYHIFDSNGAHQISLGTIVRVFPKWGSKDFRTQHLTGDIRLAADWSFAPSLKLSLNPNVGIARSEDDQGRVFTAGLFAVTLNYLPTNKLNPFIDVGAQFPEERNGESAVILDTGVAYIIGRNLQIDASVGTGARGDTAPHPFLGFGISLRSKLFARDRRHK
ncbi:MAG TPA: transporter [Pyrinomonadaceae bacterium]